MKMVLQASALWLAGCTAAPMTVGDTSSDLPLANLEASWRAVFDEGDRLFDVPFREADGLGPVYIRQSCAGCHEAAARGPGFTERLVQVERDGTATPGQPALPLGSVVRPYANGGASPMLAPARDDVKIFKRAGIPVMGRGWMEAIADSELLRVEQEQAQRTDGISGRANRVRWVSEANPDTRYHAFQKGDAALGRFGLKARQPSLDDFAADAAQGEMGLTTVLRPHEVLNAEGIADDRKPGVDLSAEQLNTIADYVRMIDIPRRRVASARGEALFEHVGCAACHVPSLRTRDDYPLPQLAGKDARVYSDLLLHDMGVELADAITDWDAGPREWRTAPLIGLRFLTAFLHDGRTDDLETAIRLHGSEGSEAKPSTDAFAALSDTERAALLDFVSSL